MEAINKVNNGLHIDFNEYDQPQDTMRDNRNGVILDLDEGAFMWTNLKGTLLIFTLLPEDKIMGTCWIRERLFMIVFNDLENYVVIYEALHDESGDFTSLENRWEGENTVLNLSIDHPIRSIFGYYENVNIQRIYWTDDFNPPRVINVKDDDQVTVEEKFANFFPIMEPVYGVFTYGSILSGGNCKAGSYFFAWRLFKEGYYTDWSYLTNPVVITNTLTAPGFSYYQDSQGGAPDENLLKRIRIVMDKMDTDYDSVQIAAFYSNDYNSAQPGNIFYDGDISASYMVIDYRGNENLGTVTIDDLMETTIVIEKCKDMTHVKKYNVLGNIKEREELNVSGAHSEAKNNQMEVSMKPVVREIMLDSRGYPDEIFTAQDRPLSATRPEYYEKSIWGLIPGHWYIATSPVTFTDDSGAQAYAVGEVFTIDSASTIATYGGVFNPIVFKSKYSLPGATDYNDMEIDYINVNYEHYNYKSPVFSHFYKGYPGGETIRLAVVFYDKTGRPFFARHLYQVEEQVQGGTELVTVGPGDFIMPPRNSNDFKTHKTYDETGNYQFCNGQVLGINISGINVTAIRDKIGGFSIVRAPIDRQIMGYGILSQMLKFTNDLTLKPGFRNYATDVNVAPEYYGFYSPEDLYELSGFVIQKGDTLVNSHYLTALVSTQAEYASWDGYGRRESETSFCLYQKFTIHTSDTGALSNGLDDAEHEISEYTRYKLGDDGGSGVPLDPADGTKLFWERTRSTVGRYSDATNVGLMVFDEMKGETTNIIGKHNLSVSAAQVLVCYIKRENNNPYGGLGDSALANTLYIGTGHYQEVTDAILASIFDGSNYIFNNIEIFGGDTFLDMFDVTRLLRNEDIAADLYNHSIIVPMESRMNMCFREGDHVARNRSYHANNSTGLRRITAGHRWEAFNYNDGYSTDNINDYYLPLPYNFKLESEYDTRMRYSPQKSYGELEDSFRKFNALDILDLATEFGAITNLRTKFNRIVYWQRDAVGYVPINERALSASQFGDPVQLGVGGIFERHDEIINMIGNSNQFGLVESAAGFHWYDAVRKIFLTLGNNLQFSQESLVKGMDSFFVNDIPNEMDTYDNPIKDFGIVGGYDIRTKLVYLTFRMPGEIYETIGYNIKSNKFVGFYDFGARQYFNYKDWLYAIGDSNYRLYQHGEGNVGWYHGNAYSPQQFTIVVKDDSAAAKIFDNFEYIGSQDTFSRFTYENSEQSIQELKAGNRNYKYRNRRWYGNFPKISRERLVDGYLKVTFYYDGSDIVTFNQLKTTFRKMI